LHNLANLIKYEAFGGVKNKLNLKGLLNLINVLEENRGCLVVSVNPKFAL